MKYRIYLISFAWMLAALVNAGDPMTPPPLWKNQVEFPDDSFLSSSNPFGGRPLPAWIKFSILLDDPATVYFQDSQLYAFHHDFASEFLDPFVGMTREQFDAVTLHAEGQQAVLGAVLFPPIVSTFPPSPGIPEYGIQFVRRDPYPREQLRDLFNAVRAGVVADPGVEAFYFPTFEQSAAAEADRDWLAAQGVPVSSADRWAEGNACYAEGWALGELKYFAAEQINAAFLAGELLPGDILLTDGVPAEVPLVAGILTLEPATPNSHVAILARTFGVPFVHLVVTEDIDRAWELIGHRIGLRAYNFAEFEIEFGACDLRLIDAEGQLDDQMVAEILELKRPPPLDLSPMAEFGATSASTEGLLPADIQYFGGKAANFGILRSIIPDNSPVAAAFSFDLWNGFLDQTLAGGETLREAINARLACQTWPPADMAALSADLALIRGMFTDPGVTEFSAILRQAVIDTLQDPQYGFDANRKIRIRSSTNVEDGDQFTGAGLYDSFSGCLADDLDADQTGPSHCDPTRSGERGIFRAIRKVFASFYNDNAYLERLRHGVDEDQVGMGLLVHHSFPDEIELANGVATVMRYPSQQSASYQITLVTQKGATSVANAEGGSIPEEVSVSGWRSRDNFSIFPSLIRPSNLVLLGESVMDWPDEYKELTRLIAAAADAFGDITGHKLTDLEYKKVAPGGDLIVKQIRAIPQAAEQASVLPFLINEPAEFCTFQGEWGDVFSNHRLKSRWRFETKNLWLSEENLGESILADVQIEYAAHGQVIIYSGPPAEWPGARYACEDQLGKNLWEFNDLHNPRAYELRTGCNEVRVRTDQSPLWTISDRTLNVHVQYSEPVFWVDWRGEVATRSEEDIQLYAQPETQKGDLLQQRSCAGPGDVSISTTFYWPPPPTGAVAGYTAPLIRWVETMIEGYTREPIVLRGYYSQTYRPGHHNFSEDFLFEPRLEPGISQASLAELRAKDIRLIYMIVGSFSGQDCIQTFGFDPDENAAGPLWTAYE